MANRLAATPNARTQNFDQTTQSNSKPPRCYSESTQDFEQKTQMANRLAATPMPVPMTLTRLHNLIANRLAATPNAMYPGL